MRDTVELSASVGKILLLIAGSLGFVVMGVLLIAATDVVGAIIGVASIVFFGCGAVIGIWRLFTMHGPVVTLSRRGFRDTRIAPETVPWTEINSITTWRSAGQKVMVLEVDEAVWSGLSLSTIARRSRSMNRSLGADGLAVSSTELQISHEALVTKTMEFWRGAVG